MYSTINDKLNALSWAIAALLLLPFLFTKGMFFDGLTYATVARNLNDGVGTWWAPHYTSTIHPVFYEHPPFSFWLHSLFYRLFGDQIWVDRFYAYTLYGVSVLLIRRIWALLIPAAHRSWIPQLIWTVTPTVIWVHHNNMLEAPLAAATLTTTWLLIESTMKRNYFWAFLGGIALFVSVGIKGPVGLFPLVVLPVFAVLFPEHRRASLYSLSAMIVSFSVIFAAFYTQEPGFKALFEGYLDRQLVPTLLGKREHHGSAWRSFLEVGKQLALPVIVLVVLAVRRKDGYPLRRESLLFFIVGLSATLPFFFMDRQHHYYFMPAMVYWILGFAMLYEQAPLPWQVARKKWAVRLSYINLFAWIIAISLSLYFAKSPMRDKGWIKTVEQLKAQDVHRIGVYPLSDYWREAAMAARYANITLEESTGSTYILLPVEAAVPQGYSEVETHKRLKRYKVYKRVAQ